MQSGHSRLLLPELDRSAKLPAMGQPITVPPPGFDDLPVEEQIDYVQALWRRIATRSDDIPSPAWHFELLEKRRESLESDADPGRPWEDVRRDLHARLRSIRK
jgi:putative addiction module component (TIGR02574 family)